MRFRSARRQADASRRNHAARRGTATRGYQMLKAQSSFEYTGVWAAVAVLTFTSLIL